MLFLWGLVSVILVLLFVFLAMKAFDALTDILNKVQARYQQASPEWHLMLMVTVIAVGTVLFLLAMLAWIY